MHSCGSSTYRHSAAAIVAVECWRRCTRRRLATLRRAAIDQMLRANERRIEFHEGDRQAVLRVDIAQMAANRPVEDFFSASKCLASNAFLFGLFDGHGGAACARHVCTRVRMVGSWADF